MNRCITSVLCLIVVISTVAQFAALSGCNGPLTPEAKELLLATYASYEAGDDALTVSHADEFLSANASSPRSAEAYYLRGMAKYRSMDKAEAEEDISIALKRAADDEVRANACNALGDMAYDRQDMAAAESMYRDAIEYAQEGSQTSGRARYRLGCVLQRQGRWEDADPHFDRVVFLLPDTDLATAAARRTHSRAWTIQAGVFRKATKAEELAKVLTSQALPAEVVPIVLNSEPAYVVRSGTYPTYEQATGNAAMVQKTQEDAFVTTSRR